MRRRLKRKLQLRAWVGDWWCHQRVSLPIYPAKDVFIFRSAKRQSAWVKMKRNMEWKVSIMMSIMASTVPNWLDRHHSAARRFNVLDVGGRYVCASVLFHGFIWNNLSQNTCEETKELAHKKSVGLETFPQKYRFCQLELVFVFLAFLFEFD